MSAGLHPAPDVEHDVVARPGGPEQLRRRDRVRASLRRSGATTIIASLATVPAVAIVGILVLVVYLSLRQNGLPGGAFTLSNYAEVYGDPAAFRALVNTVIFVAVTLAVSIGLGLPMAWLVERTNVGFRRTIYTLMVVGLVVPGFVKAMGWIYIAHPRIGFVNVWIGDLLGLDGHVVNVVSLAGMGFVQGLGLSALVFVMMSNALRSMDSTLEESARMSGASTWQILRHVTLPLLKPSLLGAVLFVGALGIAVFDVPLIIGLANNIHVFSTFLFLASNPLQGLPQYGTAAAFSSFMLVLALGFSFIYTRVLAQSRRFAVVTGKGFKPTRVSLGRWRRPARAAVSAYFLLTLVVPLAILAWISLSPFARPPSLEALEFVSLDNFRSLDWDRVGTALRNTVVLMVAAPTLTLVASVLFSWVVLRSNLRYRHAYDFVAFLPQAIPNIIIALGGLLVAVYWTRGWYDLYGSIALIVLVVAIVQISFATRMVNGALVQLSRELEEAGAMSGASTFATLRRITVPLLRPVLVFSWLWLAMLAFRELTIPTLLARGDSGTLSVAVWTLWNTGRAGEAAALAITMGLMLVPMIALYLWLTRSDENWAR